MRISHSREITSYSNENYICSDWHSKNIFQTNLGITEQYQYNLLCQYRSKYHPDK